MSFRASKPLLILLLVTLLAIPAALWAAETKHDVQVRVQLDSKDVLLGLAEMHLDIVYQAKDYVDIFVNQDELTQLQSRGYNPKVIHESVSDFYRSRLEANKEMGGYKTLSEINAYIDSLVDEHPDIISQKVSIGQTLEGRDQWAFKLSDNPNVDEDEPEVLFTAAIHAREVITPLVLRNFIQYMITNYGTDPTVTDLVNNREIWFVMCVNPDGYYHNEVTDPNGGGLWRKNRRDNGDGTIGVDLNRNYGYEWGYDDEGSSPFGFDETYRGPGPFSEPATQNMRDFIIAHNFIITLYFHSYSNLVIYPWGYDYILTPDNDVFKAICDSCATWNGYTSEPSHGLYTTNGSSDDWGYGEQTLKNKNLAITIEVGGSGDGFWPSTSRIPQLVGENLQPMLFIADIAGHPYQLRAPEPPVLSVDPTVTSDQYAVDWSDPDTLNPPVAYELVELQGPTVGVNPASDLVGMVDEGFSVSTVRFQSAPSSFFSGSEDDLHSTLTSTEPYLVQAGDTLSFQTWFDIEPDWDYGYVEVSTDGQSFTPIEGNITTTTNPHGNNLGNGITSSSSGWVEAKFDLSDYVGQEVFIRFAYVTDVSQLGDGWWIDDVYPYQTYTTTTVVSSSLTDTSYTFTNKPAGDYYYKVRAKDAEDQWSAYSETQQTSVMDNFSGDVDLDGVSSSISDLALFSMYFLQGLSVLDISQAAQIAQSDVNCDGSPLTQTDLGYMGNILYRITDPCSLPDSGKAHGAEAIKVKDDPTYSVELTQPDLHGDFIGEMDIVLTGGTEPLLGFQFTIEYDHTLISFLPAEAGDDIADWDVFHSGNVGDLNSDYRMISIMGLAWQTSDSVTQAETDPQPTPKVLVKLPFSIAGPLPDTAISTDVNFIWERCSDNTIATGAFPGPTSEGLVLSNAVFNADQTDITGLDPLYGGRAAHCDDGGLGVTPVAGINFTSGRVTYSPSCCTGLVGNIDCDTSDEVTLSDLSSLIDHLFISLGPLCCPDEGEMDDSPGVTLSDLSVLIDNLFISLSQPRPCP